MAGGEVDLKERGSVVLAWLGLALALALTLAPAAAAGDGVVRAVLFSSPTCPHCRMVREEVLPPLGDRFGTRLQVVVVNTTTPFGNDLYRAASLRFAVPLRGVPLLIVGETALVGSHEIPQRLPALVTRYMEDGGAGREHEVLALAGLGVATYLAHVEVRGIEAVCGPVGDCNTVQQSPYARLFGVVPIGVLGAAGFSAILVAWGARRWASGRTAVWAGIAQLAMTGCGTLFSIYLTFLEPFVIGATCLWCLSSAVIMTALYGLTLAPGGSAAAVLRHRSAPGVPRRGHALTRAGGG